MLNQTDQWFQTFIKTQWDERATEILIIIFQLILTYLLFIIIRAFINRIFNYKTQEMLIAKNKNTSPQRVNTLAKVTKNALSYLLYFFLFYTILSILGFPVATLVASAGIASFAFGMGAKEFVTDVINGFFIISEGQFDVDEVIEIPNKGIKGTVQSVGIRSTTLLTPSGQVYYIPNREINIVSNLSRENVGMSIELPISTTTNLPLWMQIVERETERIKEQYAEFLHDEPNIIGLTRNDNQTFSYQIFFKVTNGQQFKLTSKFYELYLTALNEEMTNGVSLNSGEIRVYQQKVTPS
ncbi:mechanosensitive ion channel family protein [Globicatella sanguinis]|uniref:mechanosensitive ion channel family protein n=1 Tax=Globicatella sanguinis TaxID=13076 RepID=UPI0025433E77|nr:mechanosensitive ion channel family protein [Globicatella sanguinis]MDK7631434.1 mechanosensitive ion channel family protein [Globicatella sanguinis]WIK67234.1 mechanosensitive ion channel family protein [Globicatella sanguinis]WKT56639.1 mechanosensitive ion channel family protein [Globicatella sanguinis]